jgi:hypothetical protein
MRKQKRFTTPTAERKAHAGHSKRVGAEYREMIVVQAFGKPYAPSAEHGPELNATEARAGARTGLYRVLVLSSLLALVVIGLVWLGIGSQAHVSPPHTDPASTTSQ